MMAVPHLRTGHGGAALTRMDVPHQTQAAEDLQGSVDGCKPKFGAMHTRPLKDLRRIKGAPGLAQRGDNRRALPRESKTFGTHFFGGKP